MTFDAEQHDIAHCLAMRRFPYWLIWWGVWTRRYWAIPCWIPSAAVVIAAVSAGELVDSMEAIEQRHPHAWPRVAVGR